MKLTVLFKTLIDIPFFFLVPVVIFFPGTILYMVLFPTQEIIPTTIPFQDDGLTTASILFLSFVFIEILLFFIGYINLRKLAALTIKRKTFLTSTVVLKFKRVGQFFSICGGSSLVALLGFKLYNSFQVGQINLGFSTYYLLLFLFIIGIFFLMLSSAFEKSIVIKSENDLTV